jgi:hypothetical protein
MAKSSVVIEPITDESLLDFCVFLTANLNAGRKVEEWVAAFRVPWECRKPNYGFLLRDASRRIVGGLGAIYSRQMIDGRERDFCNLTSWCVLEEYRAQSMRLAMALVDQRDFTITNFSPTKVVAGVLRFLKFEELDERVTFFPNLPNPLGLLDSASVSWDRVAIEIGLDERLAAVLRDHSAYPWLRAALLRDGERQCLIIFKSVTQKGVRGAKIIYLSDRELYARHLRRVSSGLLLRFAYLFTQIESRFLERRPAFSKEVAGYNRKLFLSRDLSARDIDYIYSESVCLDL